MSSTKTFVSALIAFLFISYPLSTNAQKSGFSINLIHRDSPESPFHNPNETEYDRILKAVERSATRALRLDQNAHLDAASAEITPDNGQYLMKISLGTPSVPMLAMADTGSDLIWTQCKPCSPCYTQDSPLFDPKKSSTYKDVSCSASQCKLLGKLSACKLFKSSCLYSTSYGDGSVTKGNLAFETVTLGSTDNRPVVFPKTLIGCGHKNSGVFGRKSSGMVGLGGGALSLTSQLSGSIDGKFSYCLVPTTVQGRKASRLNFGSQAVVSGSGSVTTALIKGNPDTFYFINMKAISVGNKKIPYSSGSASRSSGGNMMVDCGSTLTLLPPSVYSKLEAAVAAAVDWKRVKSPTKSLSLCFETSSGLKAPKITAHFDGGDVELKPINVLIPVSNGVLCLAFGATDSVAAFGSVAQMNFLVGFDRKAGTVSFKPADCSRA